jgi:hypothetical protein
LIFACPIGARAWSKLWLSTSCFCSPIDGCVLANSAYTARPVLHSPTPSMSAINPKVGFVSLGCPKALVDSERILTQLRVEGYQIVPRYDAADVVVVNTCGFIDSAVEESQSDRHGLPWCAR